MTLESPKDCNGAMLPREIQSGFCEKTGRAMKPTQVAHYQSRFSRNIEAR